MVYGAIVVLAMVVSLDGLVAGVAYGAKTIVLPQKARIIIGISSAFTVLLSVTVGQYIARYLSPVYAKGIGSAILVLLGLFLIIRTKAQGSREGSDSDLLRLRLRPLGVIVHILRDPEFADVDHSGNISGDEAAVLGVALALDAFGVGLGAGMAGMPTLPLVISIGITKWVFISAGHRWGTYIAQLWPGLGHSCLPGMVLILLGVWNMI